MSYKFMSDRQNGNNDSDSTDKLTVSSDARHYENSSALERFLDSKAFRIIYFLLSTAMLITGIVCLALATSQAECDQEIVLDLQNETIKIGALQEIKVFSSPVPPLLNISFASGPGHVFQFNGVVISDDRWSINFEGKRKVREILYHFNPRPEIQIIVRNSKQGKKWDVEERDLCNKEYPFENGKSFELKVIVEEKKFITYVDGDLLFDYAPAAFDPSDIYYIEWMGGVKINNVTVFSQTAPNSTTSWVIQI